MKPGTKNERIGRVLGYWEPPSTERFPRAVYLLLFVNLGTLIYGFLQTRWQYFSILYLIAIIVPLPVLANIRYALNNDRTVENCKFPVIYRHVQPVSFWFALGGWAALYLGCVIVPFVIPKTH